MINTDWLKRYYDASNWYYIAVDDEWYYYYIWLIDKWPFDQDKEWNPGPVVAIFSDWLDVHSYMIPKAKTSIEKSKVKNMLDWIDADINTLF